MSGTYLQGGHNPNSRNPQRGLRDNSNSNRDRDLDDDSYDQIDSHLDKLYHFGGLSALVLTLRRAFDELHLLELNLLTLSDAAKNATQHRNHRRNMSTPIIINSGTGTGTGTSSGVYGSISTDDTTTTAGESDDTDSADGLISPVRSYKETPTINNRKLPSIPGRPPMSSPSQTQTQTAPSSSFPSSGIPPKPPHRRMPTEGVNIDHQHHADLAVEQGGGDDGTTAVFAASPRTSTTHRPRHLLKTTITRGREPILDQINEARSRLRQTTKYAELVAAQALIFCDDDDDDKNKIPDSEKTPASKFTTVQKISSLLNLWSTFLYMTNYYIVAPTVGDYALRLGSDESMSGIVSWYTYYYFLPNFLFI